MICLGSMIDLLVSLVALHARMLEGCEVVYVVDLVVIVLTRLMGLSSYFSCVFDPPHSSLKARRLARKREKSDLSRHP